VAAVLLFSFVLATKGPVLTVEFPTFNAGAFVSYVVGVQKVTPNLNFTSEASYLTTKFLFYGQPNEIVFVGQLQTSSCQSSNPIAFGNNATLNVAYNQDGITVSGSAMGYPSKGPYIIQNYDLSPQSCGFDLSCTLNVDSVKVVNILFNPNTSISSFSPQYALSFFVQDNIWASNFGADGVYELMSVNQGIPIIYFGNIGSNPYLKYKTFANSDASVALTCPKNHTAAEAPASFNFFVSVEVDPNSKIVFPSVYEQYYSYSKFTLTSLSGLITEPCYLGLECFGKFPSDIYNPDGLNFTLVIAVIPTDD